MALCFWSWLSPNTIETVLPSILTHHKSVALDLRQDEIGKAHDEMMKTVILQVVLATQDTNFANRDSQHKIRNRLPPRQTPASEESLHPKCASNELLRLTDSPVSSRIKGCELKKRESQVISKVKLNVAENTWENSSRLEIRYWKIGRRSTNKLHEGHSQYYLQCVVLIYELQAHLKQKRTFGFSEPDGRSFLRKKTCWIQHLIFTKIVTVLNSRELLKCCFVTSMLFRRIKGNTVNSGV